MSKKKYNKRGYNQTELIAMELAKRLDIKFSNKNLIKIKETETQSSLSKEKRKENVKGAFELIDNKELEGKNIILFDDIYTTGSTADECINVLKKSNPNRILTLTIAKD